MLTRNRAVAGRASAGEPALPVRDPPSTSLTREFASVRQSAALIGPPWRSPGSSPSRVLRLIRPPIVELKLGPGGCAPRRHRPAGPAHARPRWPGGDAADGCAGPRSRPCGRGRTPPPTGPSPAGARTRPTAGRCAPTPCSAAGQRRSTGTGPRRRRGAGADAGSDRRAVASLADGPDRATDLVDVASGTRASRHAGTFSSCVRFVARLASLALDRGHRVPVRRAPVTRDWAVDAHARPKRALVSSRRRRAGPGTVYRSVPGHTTGPRRPVRYRSGGAEAAPSGSPVRAQVGWS